MLSGISRGKETAALLHKKIGVKIFDFNFFYGKAALQKFHARQAVHALTECFTITKKGAVARRNLLPAAAQILSKFGFFLLPDPPDFRINHSMLSTV